MVIVEKRMNLIFTLSRNCTVGECVNHLSTLFSSTILHQFFAATFTNESQ